MAKKKKARRKPLGEHAVPTSVKIPLKTYNMLRDLASAETTYRNRLVTVHALIRDAIDFTFRDNERLRDCFRRNRQKIDWDKNFARTMLNRRKAIYAAKMDALKNQQTLDT